MKERADIMPTALVSEGRKLHGAGSGNGGNGHGVRESGNSKARPREEDDSILVLQEIMRLVDASKEGHLSERGKATVFNGVHREMIQCVNEMLDAILLPIGEGNRILAQISGGKIDELITQTYKGDHEKMKIAVNNVAVVVQGLQRELARLADAAKGGQLSERGKHDLFKGAYAEIVRGVNGVLDAVIAPLNVAANYVDRISKGDIPAKITDTYNGDFNTIKSNLNTCIDAVNSLVSDAGLLVKAAVDGRLSTRADASKHQGDYRNVIIYFDRPTQQRILLKLANCLLPGGFMFVGHAETLHDMDLPLTPVAPALYRRIDGGD